MNVINKNMDSLVRPIVIIVDDAGIKEIDLQYYGKNNIYFGKNEFRNDIVINSENVADVQGRFILDNNNVYICDVESKYGTYVAREQHFERIQDHIPHICTNDMIIDIGISNPDDEGNSLVMICTNADNSTVWKSKTLNEGANYIGREDFNDIVIDEVSVSRVHGTIMKRGNEYFFECSKNAGSVLINGKLVDTTCKLNEKDIIIIANTKLILIKDKILYKTHNKGINLVAKNLNKVVGNGKKKKTILNNVNCEIESNDFVAIIGCSGAGKTTLMSALSGFDTDVSGHVYINGVDLHENFDALKNVIGFVPQQDIIYENLKLRRMLYYTAKMKMPKDTSKEEIYARIDEILEMVGLSEHQNTYIKKLSGGQKKRASIAVELLADPGLFFLDEPTSGLDPYIEESLMRTLQKLSKENNKTVIMVTHTTSNIDLCDKVIVMGEGGRMCFCDHASKFKEIFGCDSIVEIYSKVSQDAIYWEQKERENKVNIQSIKQNEKKKVVVNKGAGLNQLSVVIRRYLELIKNDAQLLTMLFLQPIVVALLLNIVAETGVFDIYEPTKSILFALTCAGIWIGLFDAIQEITKERDILKREYMANLKIRVYLLAKAIVLGFISLIQSALMLTIFTVLVGSSEDGIILSSSYPEMLLTGTVTIFVSVMMGLAISAIAKQGDRAMAIAPFVLMFQLLFSGILFELDDKAEFLSYFTISRWSMEAYGSISNLNGIDLKLSHIPGVIHEAEEIFERTPEHLFSALGIMGIGAVIFFVVSLFVLRRIKNEGR